ncbi:hypothetical protein CO2235_200096 [Cupriavidus oxalaticus]|uniref:Uncharacterized protein n=1 Tax=Cupriavidus oxalaticus TaxID=96344 RepID=A0A976BCP4_9BURK|nr:hypothetical protein CO2235_200096 [Cupriavidus oxalaticus]
MQSVGRKEHLIRISIFQTTSVCFEIRPHANELKQLISASQTAPMRKLTFKRVVDGQLLEFIVRLTVNATVAYIDPMQLSRFAQ